MKGNTSAARGLFITFEGGEGAGKSTLASSVRDALKAQQINILFTREPGGTPLGEKLRELLLHAKELAISSRAELLLFLASRAQHIVEVIEPALAKNITVLCDRFSDSSIAYQGAGKELGFSYVKQLCDLVQQELVPDVTFYVDIDPAIGLARVRSRRQICVDALEDIATYDRIEGEAIAFHQKVRSAFLHLADLDSAVKDHTKRIYVLDGTLPPETLLQQALEIIKMKSRS